MRRREGGLRPAIPIATVLGMALAAAAPRASGEAARPIAVGEVWAPAAGAGAADATELRRTLEGAVRAMKGRARALRARPPLVLAGSVTRLDHERLGERLRVRCEVSLLVLESPGGQMRAILTGRATSEGGLPRSAAELAGLRREVVGSAARSALDRLATVIDSF